MGFTENKSKKRVLLIIIIAVLVLLIIFFGLVMAKVISLNELFLSDNAVKGVDISSYQGKVDMKKLAEQNIRFVYIKATEGSSYSDEYFQINWENALKTDLPSGAYHFFSFDSSGITQAENYIRNVGNIKGRLLPVVDVEYYADKRKNSPEKSEVIKELHNYINTIENAYGVMPMIYTTQDFRKKYLLEEFRDCQLWIRSVYYTPDFGVGKDYTLWQYCDTAVLDGYCGDEKHIDMNVLNKEITVKDLIVI